MKKIKESDIPEPRGIEDIVTKKDIINEIKNKRMEKVMTQLPGNYGVENFTNVVDFLGTGFDGVTDAMTDDEKISLTEALGIVVSLVPKALGFISAIPKVPQEIVFDALSEEDINNIAAALDNVKNLKGDTRDATKELLPHLFGIKDWYFKYFVAPNSPAK